MGLTRAAGRGRFAEGDEAVEEAAEAAAEEAEEPQEGQEALPAPASAVIAAGEASSRVAAVAPSLTSMAAGRGIGAAPAPTSPDALAAADPMATAADPTAAMIRELDGEDAAAAA